MKIVQHIPGTSKLHSHYIRLNSSNTLIIFIGHLQYKDIIERKYIVCYFHTFDGVIKKYTRAEVVLHVLCQVQSTEVVLHVLCQGLKQ